MTSFDLNALIREQLERSQQADPHKIAERILRDGLIPVEAYEDILRELLPGYIRDMSHVDRKPQRASSPSKWVRAGRYWRVYVAGEWLWLGDCNIDDVKQIAADYRKQADALRVRGLQYTALVRVFHQHRVELVKDLPEMDVRRCFGMEEE